MKKYLSKYLSRVLKYAKVHRFISTIVLVIVVGGGYFVFRGIGGNAAPIQYITAAAQTGTIVSSVAGSGQIDVSDQVDVKPKVSGTIVSISAAKGQQVKKGALLVSLDSRDARRAVSDAEIALESAKIQLDSLPGSDAQSLASAQNALAQAQRNLQKAQDDYDNAGKDTQENLTNAYNDGYNNVSTTFFKLSGYMQDLKNILGTENNSNKYVSSYQNILGTNSAFIQNFLDNYDNANNLYNTTFASFSSVSQNSDGDTIYKTISDTLDAAKAISIALDSARHMYDAITVGSYHDYAISSTIDTMQPKIQSDLTAIYSTITSLQSSLDTIDNTIKDNPGTIEDAKIALSSAQASLQDKQNALTDIENGTASLNVRTQQNTVAQKEAALETAQDDLSNHYIRAPFDGTIAAMDDTVGDSVSSATNIATIITNVQVAKLSLNEVDIAKVQLGQPATLTFDAVDGLTLTGKVTDIDTIGTTNQGVVTYGVIITLDTTNDQVKPGMTVNASIVVGTTRNALYVPNAAVKTQANGTSYVEVLVNGIPSEKTVQTGVSNDQVTQILSGISEGDKVVTATTGGSSQATSASSNPTRTSIPGVGGGSSFRGGGGGGAVFFAR